MVLLLSSTSDFIDLWKLFNAIFMKTYSYFYLLKAQLIILGLYKNVIFLKL